jgi:rRNA maturation protein Nop10
MLSSFVVVVYVGLYRCPACGYYAFNGIECFDCGYRAV